MFNKIENKWFLDRHVASSICFFLSTNTAVTFQTSQMYAESKSELILLFFFMVSIIITSWVFTIFEAQLKLRYFKLDLAWLLFPRGEQLIQCPHVTVLVVLTFVTPQTRDDLWSIGIVTYHSGRLSAPGHRGSWSTCRRSMLQVGGR